MAVHEPQQRPNVPMHAFTHTGVFPQAAGIPFPRHGLLYYAPMRRRGIEETAAVRAEDPPRRSQYPCTPLSHSGEQTAGSPLPIHMSLTRGFQLEPPLPRPEGGAVVSLPLLGPASSSAPALPGPVLASTVSEMVVCRDSMLRAGKGTCKHAEQHGYAHMGLMCWERDMHEH